MTRTATSALSLLVVTACTNKGFLKAPEADDDVTAKVGSFSTDTHFLLEPSADAEDLLGRPVHVTSSGGWTIADERAPGCIVRVKRSAADYEKSYRIGLGDMTTMSGGYSELLKLEARYGRSVEAAMKIHNLETLTADVEGPCGEVIVKSVRVGTGERTLVRKAEGSLKGRAGKGPIGAEAGREGLTDISDEIKWSTPQAYAFTYDQAPKRKVFEIDARIPLQVKNGEAIQLELTSPEDAYLIVFYFDQSGAGTVLYPAEFLQVPLIKAGETLTLPPPEKALVAQLADPNTSTRDTVVIYAFAARGDFEQFKPASMTESSDVATYIVNVTRAVSTLPISRWDRHTATIEIVPRSE